MTDSVFESRTLSSVDDSYFVTTLISNDDPTAPKYYSTYLERYIDKEKQEVSDNPDWLKNTLLPSLKGYLLNRAITGDIVEFVYGREAEEIYNLIVLLEIALFLGWLNC